MLTVVDEYSPESLAIEVDRRLRSDDVLRCLNYLFTWQGLLAHIRSNNGPDFTAQMARDWLPRVGVKPLFIEPGSPRENGFKESFNGKLRDEFLIGEIFYTLREAKVLIQQWRHHYKTAWTHSSLGYRPPAPQTLLSAQAKLCFAQQRLRADRHQTNKAQL